MSELISSPSNPLIKQARSLRQRKAREESGLFLVEGILHVGAAVEAGWEIETLLFAPDLLNSAFALSLVERLQQTGVRCQPVTGVVFESFAEKENPPGLAALVRQRSFSLKDVVLQPDSFGVALVAPQDPGNVGTILRTLDATGGRVLFLLENGVDVYHPAVVRASMGIIFEKPFVQASFDEFVTWVEKQDIRLVATSAHANLTVDALALGGRRPTVLVFGSEQKGLSAAQLAACPERVSLPMRGRASSLNLAVAAGVLMYALTAENQKSG